MELLVDGFDLVQSQEKGLFEAICKGENTKISI
jgi:hypothetical protein